MYRLAFFYDDDEWDIPAHFALLSPGKKPTDISKKYPDIWVADLVDVTALPPVIPIDQMVEAFDLHFDLQDIIFNELLIDNERGRKEKDNYRLAFYIKKSPNPDGWDFERSIYASLLSSTETLDDIKRNSFSIAKYPQFKDEYQVVLTIPLKGKVLPPPHAMTALIMMTRHNMDEWKAAIHQQYLEYEDKLDQERRRLEHTPLANDEDFLAEAINQVYEPPEYSEEEAENWEPPDPDMPCPFSD